MLEHVVDVPARGRGVREVVELDLDEQETQRFTASADTLRTVMREFWPEA